MNHMPLSFCFTAWFNINSPKTLSPSSSLESVALGRSFLFVEGEISSERLLAGHSVLPSHNHRNPWGPAETAFCTPRLFADSSSHKHNGRNRACSLCSKSNRWQTTHSEGVHMSVWGINPTCAYIRASNYCMHAHTCLFSALHSLHF